jgi:hypothetical protein
MEEEKKMKGKKGKWSKRRRLNGRREEKWQGENKRMEDEENAIRRKIQEV